MRCQRADFRLQTAAVALVGAAQIRGTPWDETRQYPTYGSCREWPDLVLCVANGHNRTRFQYDTVEVPGSSPVVPTKKLLWRRGLIDRKSVV